MEPLTDKEGKRIALGKLLRGLRELKSREEKKPITQTDVARFIGFDKPTTVQSFEVGKIAPPKGRFKDIAAFYGKHELLTLVLIAYSAPESWELIKDVIAMLERENVIKWNLSKSTNVQELCDATWEECQRVLKARGISTE